MRKETAQCFFALVIIVGLALSAKGFDVQVSVNTCGLFLCTYPLEGAKIYVDGSFEGVTSSTGWTYIEGIPQGRHKIVAKKDGYTSDSETISASNENDLFATFTLREKETEASPSRTQGSVNESPKIEVKARGPNGGREGITVQLSRADGGGSTLVRFSGHTTFEVQPGHYIIRARLSDGGDRFERRTVAVDPGEREVVRMEVGAQRSESFPAEEKKSSVHSDRRGSRTSPMVVRFFAAYWGYLLLVLFIPVLVYLYWNRRRRGTAAGEGEPGTEVDQEAVEEIFQIGRDRDGSE